MIPLLNKADAEARRLGQSKQKIYRWTADEGMPAVRIGRSLFYVAADVDRWLQERTINQDGSNGTLCHETTTGAPQEAPAPTTKYQTTRA